MRRLQLVVLALPIAFGCVPVHGLAPASVTGVVRDSAGVPQIGAVVQLLGPELKVIASVYTNAAGHFLIPSVVPGRYSLKAMGASFLPSMQENVRVRSHTVVNLTLNTLYEVMQWLPTEPRNVNAPKDDWKWTLHTAANRPLLRWLEDGPLVVVSDGSGTPPKLKARLVATGQQGSFGESGERIAATVEETPSNSRELLAHVEFDPQSTAGMEAMLGFNQDLGFAGSVQSVAAVAVHPEIETIGAEGLDEAAMRSAETMNFGDEFDAEAGAEQVLVRLAGTAPQTATASLPFASLGWHAGDSTLRYSLTTIKPQLADSDETQPRAWLPSASERNGKLVIERGLHQELGWQRQSETSTMAVQVYADEIKDPVVEAMGRLAGADGAAAFALVDSSTGLMRLSGPNFSTAGLVATMERRLPGGNQVRLSYANGSALVMSANPAQPMQLAQLAASARPRRAQTYSLSLSGTIEGTDTRWRASYRWQPEATVTEVAPFTRDAAEPYLNLHLRQPLRLTRLGAEHVDALLDVRNLLAQGYRPYLLNDGSLLLFAQDQRGVTASLVFSF